MDRECVLEVWRLPPLMRMSHLCNDHTCVSFFQSAPRLLGRIWWSGRPWWWKSLSLCGWSVGAETALEKMLTRKCPLGCPSGQAPAHRLQSQDFRTPKKQCPPTVLSYRGQAACSLVLQSLDPGLLTPQNVLTTELNTPNLALPPQSPGHAPRPPIVAAEFRAWGDLKPPPCPGPATCASVQRTALLFHGSPFFTWLVT